MRQIILYVIIVILIAGAGWFFFGRSGNNETSPAAELRSAPEFTLKDYEGKEVRLADFQGKAVVVNAWAAWCPFCGEELKDFALLQQEFGDKIAIIAVDRAEPLGTAKKFSDDLGVTDKMIFLLDPSDSFYQSIGGFSMPETIFVDKDGFTRGHKRGPMKLEEMRRRTQEAFGL